MKKTYFSIMPLDGPRVLIAVGLSCLLVCLLCIGRVGSKPHPLMYLENKFGFSECQAKYSDEDACRNTTALITTKGYPCEEHWVTTDDGFVLSIHRIPSGHQNSKTETEPSPRPVVFLQHGLLDSSATWVLNLANQSLGFILADAGFDVWLGNMRGNTYCRHHVVYPPSDERFWQWSWDEMSDYDLPAMVDYVLSITGQQEIFYIGHSQGTLVAFSRFSRDHALAKKVKAFIGLGPVATVGHIKGLMKLLVAGLTEEKFLFDLFGVHEFLPNNELLRIIASELCSRELLQYACENFVFMISGFDYKHFNTTRMPVYFSHTPAGTSVQNIVHFAQMVKSKLFQAYDYGSEALNVEHYNQSEPPMYDLSRINVPTYLFSGSRDYLSDPEDVAELVNNLKCLVSHEVLEGWQHLDFIWSLDAAPRLYSRIIDILREHTPTLP